MLDRRLSLPVAIVVVCGLAVGCSSTTHLMPTPNLYAQPDWNPFADVPPALATDKISVLYVTDRVPTKKTPGHWEYGQERSRSAAFGEAEMRIGENVSWDALVKASRSPEREEDLALSVTSVNELSRTPEWYSALRDNCTTGVLERTGAYEGRGRYNWKVLLSGYAAEYVHECSMLEGSMAFSELSQRCLINARAEAAAEAEDFSARIREGLPAPRPYTLQEFPSSP